MSEQPQVVVGAARSRVDGRLKVTGHAEYAADHAVLGVAHAVVVDATVGRGRITGIDARAALALPGVLTVITHQNAPRLPYQRNPGGFAPPGRALRPFESDEVKFFGQPVAVAVATTLEAAQHAAGLVEVRYAAEQPVTDLEDTPGDEAVAYARGDADRALADAPVTLDVTYRAARNHHNPMELNATTARWDGDRLTLWDKPQWVMGTRGDLAAVFGIPAENVRVVSPFVGGAFGNAIRTWPHVVVAAMAARQVRRPVKLVLSRKQLYPGVGYRPAHRYWLRLGSDRRGRLSAAVHEMRSETSRYERHVESVSGMGQMFYTTPHVRQDYRVVPLDVNTPTAMRGPGAATAAYVIESAMDELAYELGLDPIELRLRNEPDTDPASGLPFSTRRLRECYETGARAFGWDRRDPRPRSTRDGDWLVGTGMAAGCYHALRSPCQALVRIDARGRALVRCAASDMGPGTYTSVTQLAADALGLAMPDVEFRLGDSTLPAAPPQGGSQTMASVGSAVQDGCDRLRRQAIALAVEDPRSPLHAVAPEDVIVQWGRLRVRHDPGRGESYRRLLAHNGRTHLEVAGSFTPDAHGQHSSYAYAATFAEVGVDARLGLVRVRRMVGVYDTGRIINPKLAESQALGGTIGGIGAALLEHGMSDPRDGRLVNASLADYLVPVNADVPDLAAIYLDGDDYDVAPIGVKGLGEIVLVGVAPAIGNAVFHATGRRVREIPITAEALL